MNDDTLDAQPPNAPAGRDPLELGARWVIADRYEILGLLGSGGMGTVYRARDRELDEIVALKVLKKQVAATEAILERFRREVKLARRVTHRNVARTFDIGEHAGAKFLTMEFVDGEMLGALLLRRGRLRIGEVVRIGKDLCAGLSAAHAAGVLHRDLKPANVVVARDGRSVITDFGIARILSEGASARSAGSAVGTPAYMSPEQLQAVSDLDERADVYALGTILFELLTGELPWASEQPMTAALKRIREPPPDPRVLRPTLSDAAAELVLACTATRREDRPATADAVSSALDLLAGIGESSPSVVPPIPSRPVSAFVRTTVALLPIVNESGPESDYLAESLAHDLRDVLDAVPEICVRPRNHGGPIDAEIGGALRASGENVRVSLRLLTVEDGIVLWEGRFERAVSEIIAIVDAAAAAIAEALTTKAMASPRSLPKNPAAHDLYLRGRYAFVRGWYDRRGDCVRLLAEAHALSPDDAEIAATYARALARGYGVSALGEPGAHAAKDMAHKAIALEPRSSDGHLALALVHLYRGESVGAAGELRRAMVIAPRDPDVLEMLGRMRSEIGPLERAIEHLEAALAHEPRFAEARYTMARAWALLGDRRRAEQILGTPPADPIELVPYLLTSARLALWWKDGQRTDLERKVTGLGQVLAERSIAAVFMNAIARGTLTREECAVVEEAFPSGSTVIQRAASAHGQLRAELYLACGETERGTDALRDADANGLIDICWLERCPLLEQLRGDRDFEATRRSTAVRAKRVTQILEG